MHVPPEIQEDLLKAQRLQEKLELNNSHKARDDVVQSWESLLLKPELRMYPKIYWSTLNSTIEALLCRYWAFEEEKDLDKVIDLLRDQSKIATSFKPLHNLGRALMDRYAFKNNISDLEEAIEAYYKALTVSPVDPPYLALILKNLGLALVDRYYRKHAFSDLEKAIIFFQRIVEITPIESPDHVEALNRVGAGLFDLYCCKNYPSDLDKSVTTLKKARMLASENSDYLPYILNNLGNSLVEWGVLKTNFSYVDEGIDILRNTVRLTSESSSDLPTRLSALASSLLTRYTHKKEITDLNEAVEFSRKAVSLTPENSPSLSGRLGYLGSCLNHRFLDKNDPSDLREAIKVTRKAVALTSEEDLYLPKRLYNLSICLENSYEYSGHLSHLNEAIENMQKVVKLTQTSTPDTPDTPDILDLPDILSKLGILLGTRYNQTNNPEDIEEAIENSRKAVNLILKDSPDFTHKLSLLGNMIRIRYEHKGDEIDLNEYIETFRKMVSLTPIDSPYLSGRLNNLGIGLRLQYEIYGDISDLQEAITTMRKSVESLHEENIDLARSFNELGIELRLRYEIKRDPSDLKEAINILEKALRITPEGSPYKPIVLNSLSNALRQRFAINDNISDLKESIEHLKKAVKLTPDHSQVLISRLMNLGHALRMKYNFKAEISDLEEAYTTYHKARIEADNIFYRSNVAYKLGFRKLWNLMDDCIVKTALDLNQVVNPDKRQYWGREAMKGAEGAKSLILTEILGLFELSTPSSVPQDIAARENQLVRELVEIDRLEFSRTDEVSPKVERFDSYVAQNKRRAEIVKELASLWRYIKLFGPEAEEFVSFRTGHRSSWGDLLRLTEVVGSDTAIMSIYTLDQLVVLFILRYGYSAPLIVKVPISLDLEGDVWRRFTREVHRYYDCNNPNQWIKETWQSCLLPLFQSASPHLEGIKRIVFSPYRVGHQLPWVSVAQRVGLNLPWITIPALGNFAQLASKSFPSKGDALVIGNPLGDLPYSEKAMEDIGKNLNTEPLTGYRATKEVLLKALSEARIVHISTHFIFDSEHPLNSGIILKDGMLTVRDVMGRRICSDLIVLSACETGRAPIISGDEMAGLTQAFLQAGAKSLLVSLWPVNDRVTADLMTNFYKIWITEKKDKAEALHQAMSITRQHWPHTHYWGAFTLIGNWK